MKWNMGYIFLRESKEDMESHIALQLPDVWVEPLFQILYG